VVQNACSNLLSFTMEHLRLFIINLGSIKFLRGLLEECCEHSNHKSKLFNYNVLEIIGGMNRLAVNDENKMALVEEGVLRYYAQLVTEGSLQEREEACKGLWTLSFNKEIAMEIMDNDALMNGEFTVEKILLDIPLILHNTFMDVWVYPYMIACLCGQILLHTAIGSALFVFVWMCLVPECIA